MKLLKFVAVLVAAAGVAALAIVYAPAIAGQRGGGPDPMILRGPGASIGVAVSDADSSDKTGAAGVVVEEVRSGSPAEKAGVKRGDVVVEFDGEHVRSARQFRRLVSESRSDRAVKATVVRDGKRLDLQITPEAWTGDIEARVRERLRDLDLEGLGDRMRDFSFDFELSPTRARLGVTVQELTPQLEAYFGVKHGVLVASVSDGSPADKAGVKAGDVITAIDGSSIWTRADVTRALRDADGETTIGVTRDRKELTVKANVVGRARSTRRDWSHR